jgi:radical SAM superfamily enzyme YgiQ (UPF0313 family)
MDGQHPRQRASDIVIEEIVQLRRRGFRFIALADDNFYPVSLRDIQLAERQNNQQKIGELRAIRAERFELMACLAELPEDMVFFTQITMEAAEDTQFLDAMRRARIMGALVGVEAVTPEGLKAVYKDFNCSGDQLVRQLQRFREHGIHLLGSFIFGLPTDRQETFDATQDLAQKSGLTFAQFVMLTPFPGTVDFDRWEKAQGKDMQIVSGIPITRYWLVPAERRLKMFMPHQTMSSEQLRQRTQQVWDEFYSLRAIWKRSRLRYNIQGPPGVPVHLEALSPDVRKAQALRPIALAWPAQRISPDGWQNPAYVFFRRVQCQNCKTHGGRKPPVLPREDARSSKIA